MNEYLLHGCYPFLDLVVNILGLTSPDDFVAPTKSIKGVR